MTDQPHIDTIWKEVGRLNKSAKFDNCVKDVDRLLERLQQAKRQINEQPDNEGALMQALQADIKGDLKKLEDSEKTVYSSISKFGKSLEKTFKQNQSDDSTTKQIPIQNNSPQLNGAIAMHLARTGQFEAASSLVQESQVEVPQTLLNEFAHLYGILQHINSENLDPAIEWATSQRGALVKRGSNLEFSLHKLKYIRYLTQEKNVSKALNYAQNTLANFSDRYLDEISKLMSSILYIDWRESPYEELLSYPTFQQLAELFASEFCCLLGLTPESPLYLAVTAGSIAMPILSRIGRQMKSQRVEWSSKEELPVDCELPSKYTFHAIFVCPVSKEQTTERNPPMVLRCGHLLAKETLKSLSNHRNYTTFKCPYCPCETSYNEAVQVYF